jgi:hypothetical protein
MKKIVTLILLFSFAPILCLAQEDEDSLINGQYAGDAVMYFTKRHYKNYEEQIQKLTRFFQNHTTHDLKTLVTVQFTKTKNFKNLEHSIKNAKSLDFKYARVFCEVKFPYQDNHSKILEVNFSKGYANKKWIINSSSPSLAKLFSLQTKEYEGHFVETFFNDFVQDFNNISENKIYGISKHNLFINNVLLKTDSRIDTVYFKFSYYDMTHKENNKPRSGYILEDFVSTLKAKEDIVPKETPLKAKKDIVPKETPKAGEKVIASAWSFYNIRCHYHEDENKTRLTFDLTNKSINSQQFSDLVYGLEEDIKKEDDYRLKVTLNSNLKPASELKTKTCTFLDEKHTRYYIFKFDKKIKTFAVNNTESTCYIDVFHD